MQILTKLFLRSIPIISYYAEYLPNRLLRNKVTLRKAETLDFSQNPAVKECLNRTADYFTDWVHHPEKYIQKSAFIAEFKNATFLGNSGALVIKNKVVAESTFDESRLLKSPAFRLPGVLFNSTKKGRYTSIMHLPWAGGNIYHWFLDCLPRLYSIKQIPGNQTIFLVLQASLKPYMKETLNFFLKQDTRLQVLYINPNQKWNLETFWLPSFVSNNLSGYLPLEYFNFVKETILKGYNLSNVGANRRIYISRSLAPKRKIANEDEIILILQNHGIEIVHAEKLSYADQVKLFAESNLIIGGHGAGLTNILFSGKAKVIEIQPEDVVKSHYCLLSVACGHQYYGFYTDKTINNNLDYMVEPENFGLFLAEII